MMGALSRPGDGQVKGVHGLAHGYAIASHVHHADWIGITLHFELDLRADERRDTIHEAHSLRLISEPLSFLLLRLLVGYRFVTHDMRPIQDAAAEVEKLRLEFGDVYDSWLRVEYPDGPGKG